MRQSRAPFAYVCKESPWRERPIVEGTIKRGRKFVSDRIEETDIERGGREVVKKEK